ncbi:MAG: carboxypeptidase M32, partial [Bacteroidetes bacterium]|nr:carboxypeptidase M32 [Bacteroidota bacterium]
MHSDLLKYYRHLKETAALRSALSLLQWDQEVNMPISAATSRANQISILSGLVHEKYTNREFINLTNKLYNAADLTKSEKRSVAKTLKNITKSTLLSKEFVEKVSSVTSHVFNSWLDARKNNNANDYLKTLQELVDIKKREYELKYPGLDVYEGCLDEYDEGVNTSELDRLFKNLLPGIDQIIANIPKSDDDFLFLKRHYPADKQWKFGLEIMQNCGFDFRAGRQDKSAHPFTITISEGDIRITTRIDENNFAEMFWSSMHELGHGLYEQGIPQQFEGAPESEACSISIHESQSRFWENHIGRSS